MVHFNDVGIDKWFSILHALLSWDSAELANPPEEQVWSLYRGIRSSMIRNFFRGTSGNRAGTEAVTP